MTDPIFNVVPATSITPQTLTRVLGWGASGAGKTQFISTWERPVLILDFDKNTQCLADEEDIYIISFTEKEKECAWLQCDAFLRQLQKWWGAEEWTTLFPKPKTLVVDSLTFMTKAMLRYASKLSGGVPLKKDGPKGPEDMRPPTMGDYLRVQILFENVIEMLKLFNINLFVTGHEQRHADELEGKMVKQPLIFGKTLPGRLPVYFDSCFHFVCETSPQGEAAYHIEFVPTRLSLVAKTSLKGLGAKRQWEIEGGMREFLKIDREEREKNSEQKTTQTPEPT